MVASNKGLTPSYPRW